MGGGRETRFACFDKIVIVMKKFRKKIKDHKPFVSQYRFGNFSERSFEGVTPMTSDDVSDVELTHGYNPEDAGGVALFYQSSCNKHTTSFLGR